MSSEEYFLNEHQVQAVETTEGYVRVVAGAGSGKTRTLAMRFAYLCEMGILPENILSITFTNKAAGEMRTRIRSLVRDEETGTISTFHSLCSMILREESHIVNYPKSFVVLDNSDIDDILRQVYEENGLTLRDMTFSKARDMIEIQKIKNHPEYVQELVDLSPEQLAKKYAQSSEVDDIIFYGYLCFQKKNFGLDYNDLILLTLKIFKENPQTAEKWQDRFEYIMVDEFQDIDPLQYELVETLVQVHHNLFIVGDPDQTIYTWRGANVRFLLDFDRRFPGTQTIFLNENYRSTPQILNCANELISKNKNRIEKYLIPVCESGDAVRAGHFESPEKEGGAITARIHELSEQGFRYKDMAVLYRAHYLSRPVEDALIEAQIPYTICSGVPFFSREEIKTALAYCRMLLYKNDLDFLRTINMPARNIGKGRIQFLKEYAEEHSLTLYQALLENLHTPRFESTQAESYVELVEHTAWQARLITRVLDEVLLKSGYEKELRLKGAQDRLDNLAELKQAAAEYELSWGEDTTLDQWLTHTALFSAGDQSTAADRVRLMTVHNAKSLEFDAVFLMGLNEGIFPSRQTKTIQAMEEERRLAFVGVTRAKKELYLSEAAGLLHSGSMRMPSRFLFDIGLDNVLWEPPIPKNLQEAAGRMIKMKSASLKGHQLAEDDLQAGDLVEHAIFGRGVILDLDAAAGKITVQFDSLQTKRVLSAKARLKKIGSDAISSIQH